MTNHKYYQLHDFNNLDVLGIVIVTSLISPKPKVSEENEIQESWTEFNKLEEHYLDPRSVEDFVQWHNLNRVVQIQLLDIINIVPDSD